MRVCIHQPNFLPWLGFFAKVAQSDLVIFLDDVPYSKGSFTNRVKILGPKGPEWLTVPVRHDFGQIIRNVLVNGTEWERNAYAQVHRAYRGSPGWNAALVARLLHSPNQMLLNLNIRGIEVLPSGSSHLMLARHSSDLRSEPTPGVPGLIELAKAAGATTYVAGLGAAKYDDPAAWEAAGIRYERMKFVPPDGEGFSALHYLMRGLSVSDVVRKCIR